MLNHLNPVLESWGNPVTVPGNYEIPTTIIIPSRTGSRFLEEILEDT